MKDQTLKVRYTTSIAIPEYIQASDSYVQNQYYTTAFLHWIRPLTEASNNTEAVDLLKDTSAPPPAATPAKKETVLDDLLMSCVTVAPIIEFASMHAKSMSQSSDGHVKKCLEGFQ
eukprot:GHVO01011178.1.p1 GENE.GHVO01011178.1~~GHVO01011178.1.p1  ORF type:complete len:128 (-),score=32.55 GHVO01011178.1:1-348(-)